MMLWRALLVIALWKRRFFVGRRALIAIPERLLFGHRGVPARVAENTIAGFELAMELGAHGVEFDVQATADGHLVVIHDDDVKRTCGVDGLMREMAFARVRELNAASYKPGPPRLIPTFAEALDALPDGAWVNVEMKALGQLDVKTYVAKLAHDAAPHAARLHFIWSSFHPGWVGAAQRAGVKGLFAALTSQRDAYFLPTLFYLLRRNLHTLNIPAALVSSTVVKAAHQAGLRVLVWTVNDQQLAQQLYATGVDGIFTDDVATLTAASTTD